MNNKMRYEVIVSGRLLQLAFVNLHAENGGAVTRTNSSKWAAEVASRVLDSRVLDGCALDSRVLNLLERRLPRIIIVAFSTAWCFSGCSNEVTSGGCLLCTA